MIATIGYILFGGVIGFLVGIVAGAALLREGFRKLLYDAVTEKHEIQVQLQRLRKQMDKENG